MAYHKGNYYIWASEGVDQDYLHIWAVDGEDSWGTSAWVESIPDEVKGEFGPGGVAIPEKLADEYVVMRFAELLRDKKVSAICQEVVTAKSKHPLAEYVAALGRFIENASFEAIEGVFPASSERLVLIHSSDKVSARVPPEWLKNEKQMKEVRQAIRTLEDAPGTVRQKVLLVGISGSEDAMVTHDKHGCGV